MKRLLRASPSETAPDPGGADPGGLVEPRSFRGRLRNRLLFFLLMPIIALIASFGFYLYKVVEIGFQDELSKRLVGLAQFSASQLSPHVLLGLKADGQSSAAYQRVRSNLVQLRQTHDLSRIYVFDRDRRSVVDTRSGMQVGSEYLHLLLYQRELERLMAGSPLATVLYAGRDDRMYMTAFAIVSPGTGGLYVGVEASASFFEILAKFRRHLVQLLLLGVLAITLISSLFVRYVLSQLSKVMDAIREIGAGKLDQKVAVESKDELGFFIATFNDMQRRILDRDQHLTMMLQGIAHEVRNPLGGIELFLGLLAEEVARNPEALDYLERIRGETRNLQELVEQFLNYAKEIHLEKRPWSLADFLDEILPFFRPQFEARSIRVEVDLGSAVVAMDGVYMRRVFFNLVKNALQALPDSGGWIAVRGLQKRESGRDWQVISVADNGSGISPEALPNVFKPFYTTKEQGSGLGLALVARIVEAHRGKVELESAEGLGTTVRVYLPAD